MEPDKVPTKEEVVKTLETIYKGLPEIIEQARQGIFDTVTHEGMVVLNNMPKNIITVSVKKFTAIFNTL